MNANAIISFKLILFVCLFVILFKETHGIIYNNSMTTRRVENEWKNANNIQVVRTLEY